MLFGTGAFTELPFSTPNPLDGNVGITAGANALTINVGTVTVTGQGANVILSSDPLTLVCQDVVLTADANITVTANPLNLNSADVTAQADGEITISAMGLTLKSQTVTITGGANISSGTNQLTVTANDVGVITWNPIIPGATNVWKEIEPY
tara:strand:+ start:88 stop:540 length:453 start_codon:yes stop_codon:yes gene_type:complete